MSKYSDALRVLSMDIVEKAKSGHPGAPMGMAEMAEVVWRKHLRINPKNPHWANRDRFVLSNGHASALLYSLLYLTGHSLTLEDLQQFRQLHSKTPGHPEMQVTEGVETTTGPLGQGLANAVGFALAEKILAAQFNKDKFPLIDHFSYAFVGDGCLMEGISHEACSLAGVWQLNKLIVFYDSNHISIDGKVDSWFQDKTKERFLAYGWNVLEVDGHQATAIEQALEKAKQAKQPSLIICQTTIAKGSPNKANTAEAHGSPLGEKEIAETRKALAWDQPPFVIPEDIKAGWDLTTKGKELEKAWNDLWTSYQQSYPAEAKELARRLAGEVPSDSAKIWQQLLEKSLATQDEVATRKASQQVLEMIAPFYPELLGGSADLTPSNLTKTSNSKAYSAANPSGNYLHYGVREFAMAAVMNGLSLHCGFIPYGGTFLVFSDYLRPALRLSALMQRKVIYVLTHDSIGAGEDGPTHQPVEHLAALRIIPNLSVWRPADLRETAVAWKSALTRKGPTVLALSRQNLPALPHTTADLASIEKGGYLVAKTEGKPADLVLIASGSEVSLALQAKNLLEQKNLGVQLVSLPEAALFFQQDPAYQAKVLPKNLPVVVIEASLAKAYYRQFLNQPNAVVEMQSFGESAPAKDLYQHFGLTPEAIVKAALQLVAT